LALKRHSHDESLVDGDVPANGRTAAVKSREPRDGRSASKRTRRGRKDKDQLHITHHNILSRHLLEALVNAGENLRELRRLQRELRAELQASGLMPNYYSTSASAAFGGIC
jgi:hypothetical protein